MSSTAQRRADLDRLYALLQELSTRLGGPRRLDSCHGRLDWPRRGVYFFFEPGEYRADGHTPRVVRVGTHAVSTGSQTTLWNRLSQHRGSNHGSGNHRGSIFRLHVGTALLNARHAEFAAMAPTWGRGSNAARSIEDVEVPLEAAVSRYIGAMPFLWLAVDDAPSPTSERHIVESTIIALLSNAARPPIDPPSPTWLGHHADRPAIRHSGLWNVSFVHAPYSPGGLIVLEARILAVPGRS